MVGHRRKSEDRAGQRPFLPSSWMGCKVVGQPRQRLRRPMDIPRTTLPLLTRRDARPAPGGVLALTVWTDTAFGITSMRALRLLMTSTSKGRTHRGRPSCAKGHGHERGTPRQQK